MSTTTDNKVEGFELGCTYEVISGGFDFDGTNGLLHKVGDLFTVNYVTDRGHALNEDDRRLADDTEFHMCKKVEELPSTNTEVTTIDAHYNNWYTLTPEDIELGKIKIDPYLYYGVNSIGNDDEFGCKMHMLKNLSRHKESNSQEREIVGLYKTIKRMAELNGIKLEEV